MSHLIPDFIYLFVEEFKVRPLAIKVYFLVVSPYKVHLSLVKLLILFFQVAHQLNQAGRIPDSLLALLVYAFHSFVEHFLKLFESLHFIRVHIVIIVLDSSFLLLPQAEDPADKVFILLSIWSLLLNGKAMSHINLLSVKLHFIFGLLSGGNIVWNPLLHL